jgi:hypothetical protein
MSKRLAVLVATMISMTACSSDADVPASGWAIVKVEIEDTEPPLASICFEAQCRLFDPADEVRGAEYSAFVEPGTEFEVLLVGDVEQTGSGAVAPIGGCTLVKFGDETGFVGGCDAPTP